MSDKGPQIRRRETWIVLPGEYEGFSFRVWVNAPGKLWADINSGNEKKAVEALQQVVLEHNGWLDFDSNLYPPADTPEFWQAIPTELAACVLVSTQTEMQKVPNSLAPMSRRSKSG